MTSYLFSSTINPTVKKSILKGKSLLFCTPDPAVKMSILIGKLAFLHTIPYC